MVNRLIVSEPTIILIMLENETLLGCAKNIVIFSFKIICLILILLEFLLIQQRSD